MRPLGRMLCIHTYAIVFVHGLSMILFSYSVVYIFCTACLSMGSGRLLCQISCMGWGMLVLAVHPCHVPATRPRLMLSVLSEPRGPRAAGGFLGAAHGSTADSNSRPESPATWTHPLPGQESFDAAFAGVEDRSRGSTPELRQPEHGESSGERSGSGGTHKFRCEEIF